MYDVFQVKLHLGQLRFGPCLQMTYGIVKPGRGSETLVPGRFWEENQVGSLIFHHHIFFIPSGAALNSSQVPSFEQSVSGCCKKKSVITNLVWNSER